MGGNQEQNKNNMLTTEILKQKYDTSFITDKRRLGKQN
jgi:hypothetical protein